MDIIDIGSNSVRLYDGRVKTVITTRLAENMSDSLAPIPMERTVNAIKKLSKNRQCCAFATEAVRKAANKSDFIKLVEAETGLKIHVLSGEEEAEISFLGATNGVKGSAAVMDLGGASCEMIYGKEGKISFCASFPFGCVTLKDRFGADFAGIDGFVKSLIADLPAADTDNFFAVGGTVTSLAAMALRLDLYDPKAVHGYCLSCDKISALISEVASGATFPTLSPERRKTIVHGAYAILAVLHRLGRESVTVSESDNLEGYKLKYLM